MTRWRKAKCGTNSIPQVVGQAVRRARLGKGWSQGMLGKRAGIAKQNITRLERGTTEPTLFTLSLVSRALGVPLASLVGGL